MNPITRTIVVPDSLAFPTQTHLAQEIVRQWTPTPSARVVRFTGPSLSHDGRGQRLAILRDADDRQTVLTAEFVAPDTYKVTERSFDNLPTDWVLPAPVSQLLAMRVPETLRGNAAETVAFFLGVAAVPVPPAQVLALVDGYCDPWDNAYVSGFIVVSPDIALMVAVTDQWGDNPTIVARLVADRFNHQHLTGARAGQNRASVST